MKQTFFLFALLIFIARAATDLPAGAAKGWLTYDGATAELKFAAAFVDQKDERKSIVLLISDRKLPVEKWIRKGFLLLPSNFLGAPARHAEVQT
jgi:hypothetical protein